MHDERRITEARVRKLLERVIRPALYSAARPLALEAWHVEGEPVPFADARRASYEPMALGDTWGRPWATTWLRATGEIPAEWQGCRVEAIFDLGFDLSRGPGGQAEGLVYQSGSPVQGLHPYSRSVLLTADAAGAEDIDLMVELAANPDISGSQAKGTHYGSLRTAGDKHLYQLKQAELAVRDEEVWHLIHDIEVLDQLMHELPEGASRRHEILYALRRCADALVAHDVSGTAPAARAQLVDVLARPAHGSAHTVTAVGHAHIDSAWLWPVRETMRKCARTFTNMTTLAAEYPELVFACSSAQQYAWIKERQPEVFERIKKGVTAGNWAPVGGMWVEADGNLPGGEALARQLVYGRRFFAEEFGIEQQGVWLPDSFGYTAAYPQLAKLAGARWFLTQKLSWNETNRLPHHTFDWEGIDGTRIFTHFPPVDTYSAELSAAELAHAERNFADKGPATRSLAPFGYGDGGGGPTRSMLERARRLRDLEGSPRVEVDHPNAFFDMARAEYKQLPVWRGELYLENHRGTYTSQARTKRGNRRSEALLREAELWAATAAVRADAPYPYEELEAIWRRVLLNQFHDILPGTSIAWVHEQAEQVYGELRQDLEAVIDTAADRLGGDLATGFLNAGPYDRREVAVLPARTDGTGPAPHGQRLSDGRTAVLADVAALGTGGVVDTPTTPVTVRAEHGGFVLDNGTLTIAIDAEGLVSRAYDHDAGRDAIAPGTVGNLLQLHPDDPNVWSAWNIDPYYRDTVRDLREAHSVTLAEEGPLLASVRVERRFGSSILVQHLELTAESKQLTVRTDIDWQERDTVLKAAWPLDVHAEHESAEIQFGHVRRPTHQNTSWDAARFELWAHRWVHVGERRWGAAVLNDSTYGHDIARDTREDGGTTTTLRLSLLRSPHSPDPQADRGRHTFTYALVVGAGIEEAVSGGYALNLPLRPTAAVTRPLVALDTTDVVVEAVKLADDRSGDVVVRLYEACGGGAKATLTADFPVTAVSDCDLLENPEQELPLTEGVAASFAMRPFQVRTLRLHRPQVPA
ncbi:alpha-mannosidase [Streptomyces sp. NPDC086082]|uniref:alpha-mannosidase n=1 Tax=Streptomyces sp. NPDC086082 TaxID=3365750 RepID=UPI00382455C7